MNDEQDFSERISKEDLILIDRAINKTKLAVAEAEKASLEAKNAELEYNILVQKIYLKYSLNPSTKQINPSTGEIIDLYNKEKNEEQD